MMSFYRVIFAKTAIDRHSNPDADVFTSSHNCVDNNGNYVSHHVRNVWHGIIHRHVTELKSS